MEKNIEKHKEMDPPIAITHTGKKQIINQILQRKILFISYENYKLKDFIKIITVKPFQTTTSIRRLLV